KQEKTAFRLEVTEMYEAQSETRTADEELVEVLTAISVVSKRLARNLSLLAAQSKSKEGAKTDERNVRDNRRTAQVCCCYQRRG
ncbi:MAG: hypothetical protein RR900_03505, partial [Ruthenibacterium sp.]